MRFLFIHFVSPENSINSKIEGQKNAYVKLCKEKNITFFSVDVINKYTYYLFYVGYKYIKIYKPNTKLKVLFNVFFGYRRFYKLLYKFTIENEIDTIYIRKPQIIDYNSYNFIRKISEKSNIIFEIPTYPYLNEFKKTSLLKYLDMYYMPKIAKVIGKFVTFSDHKKIYGTDCINISNGYDETLVRLSHVTASRSIRFTCVAGLSKWHNLDRFLDALSRYYNSNHEFDVYFHIVGDGHDKHRLMNYAKSLLNISEHVIFHGFLKGEALDNIFDNTDICIGNLEMSVNRNLEEVKPLKHREYAARGLPFIYGMKDNDFAKMKYALYLGDNEFEIIDIINWYKSLNYENADIRKSVESLSWYAQLNNVIESIYKK